MLFLPHELEVRAMSQLTIYLDEASMQDVRKSAKRENVSVSLWARKRLTEAIRHTWPRDYFELFGALRDSGLTRPAQGDLTANSPRKAL
jgi:hypothetical protein